MSDSSESAPKFKYGLLAVAVVFFLAMCLTPPPQSLVRLVQQQNPLGYSPAPGTTTITGSVNKLLETDLSPKQVAYKAKVMVAILCVAAFLWGTEAIPLGATDLLVGSLLYLFGILPFDSISKAYMKDAVFFIFGVLCIAVGVRATGLDRRIAMLLLGRVRSLKAFCFLFFPLLAVASGFFSAHALVAILVPVLLRVYRSVCDFHKIKSDRGLALTFFLGICFACNQGGPGSPAAGGRNAVMVGYLKDYGKPILFWQWLIYAMPYVLVVSVVVAAFMYLAFRRKITVPNVDFSRFAREEVKRLGKMRANERVMAVILATVALLWITSSKRFGLGGPSIFAVVLMLIFRVISWRDIQTQVRFDVVGLYAAACAMGVGLKATGASLWLANQVVQLLPHSLGAGDSLIIAISVFTTGLTNFMSDGATVAAIGPVALSMAALKGIHVWKVGLACSFSSSFANATIVGTPNNAIAYVGAVDPETGERLLTLKDFFIYGIVVTLLAGLVFWTWGILGYWHWMPWY